MSTTVLHSRAAPSLDLLTIIATLRNSAFKLSGNSCRPAYPGFIVMYTQHVRRNAMFCPSKSNLSKFAALAICIVKICCATTLNTVFKNQNSDAGANVVVKLQQREKFKAVSNTVWVCWKAMI